MLAQSPGVRLPQVNTGLVTSGTAWCTRLQPVCSTTQLLSDDRVDDSPQRRVLPMRRLSLGLIQMSHGGRSVRQAPSTTAFTPVHTRAVQHPGSSRAQPSTVVKSIDHAEATDWAPTRRMRRITVASEARSSERRCRSTAVTCALGAGDQGGHAVPELGQLVRPGQGPRSRRERRCRPRAEKPHTTREVLPGEAHNSEHVAGFG